MGRDVESLAEPLAVREAPVSRYYQALCIIIWMACNIVVTMLNKATFAVVDFKYPYALSAVHMACNIVGTQMYFFAARTEKPKAIDPENRKSILLFSVVFSLNVAIGNISLRWVSVNFNQVSRSLVPALVMIISTLFYAKKYSSKLKLAIVPVVLGVALTFYGDMSYTAIGAFYTMFCVCMAALKAIVSGELLTGELKLHPLDLLHKMCPLALIQILCLSILSGEVSEIMQRWPELAGSSAPQVVLFSGILSFALNVSSFVANKVTSPLTLCISANLKQVLLVLFGTLYFGDHVSLINGMGIVIVLAAGFNYGLVSVAEKTAS